MKLVPLHTRARMAGGDARASASAMPPKPKKAKALPVQAVELTPEHIQSLIINLARIASCTTRDFNKSDPSVTRARALLVAIHNLVAKHFKSVPIARKQSTSITHLHLKYLFGLDAIERAVALWKNRAKVVSPSALRKEMPGDLERIYRSIGIDQPGRSAEEDIEALATTDNVTGPWSDRRGIAASAGRATVSRWLLGRRMGIEIYGRQYEAKSMERFAAAFAPALQTMREREASDGMLIAFLASSLGIPRERVPLAAALLGNELLAPQRPTRRPKGRTRKQEQIEAKLDEDLKAARLASIGAWLSISSPRRVTSLAPLGKDERRRADKLLLEAFPGATRQDIGDLYRSFEGILVGRDQLPGLVKVEGMNRARSHGVSRRPKKR
ncbi:MAG: hypothetical protein JST54_27155 [Deltaproteobacteria bacterium]|nr:hypothetical protein [Deltaproteobacteria bacterium]